MSSAKGLGIVVALSCAELAFGQTLTGLGTHPTSGQPVRPAGVSDDGAVLAGWVHDGVALHAIRWTSAGGMQDLGVAPGASHSFGKGVSGDGSVIVGDEHGGPNGGGAFLWTSAGGLQPLGPSLGWVTSNVSGVSGDGVSVVGNGQALDGHYYGYLWTSAGGMLLLDPLDQFTDDTPTSVSRDGSVAAGGAFFGCAFRWSSAGGMQNLGTFPGQSHAQAVDLSDDGSVVVGSSGTWTTSTGWAYLHAFRWTAGAGMQDLGVLPGDVRSEALGISGDGSIVVGTSSDPTLGTQRAFVWTSTAGMVELSAYVGARGVNLAGWDLGEVQGISADGTALFGFGLFNNAAAGWIVTELGAPVSASYCTAGTSTNGCTPTMSSSGLPSAAANSGFVLTCSGVEGAQQGLIFYGINGPSLSAWGTSTSFLCVKAPLERMGAMPTGGTPGTCAGSLGTDFLNFIATHGSALGGPLYAGEVFAAQGWYRDPPSPKTTMLSDALQWTMLP